MAAVENIEWLNQNMLRAYPLREDSDMVPELSSGAKAAGVVLPTCLVTDFSFTLAFSAVGGSSVPSLTGFTVSHDGVSVEVSLGDDVLCTAFASVDQQQNTVYRVTGRGANADCGGWIVIGDARKVVETTPDGVYRFPPGAVPFEVSTLHMAPQGVRSVTAVGKYGLKTYAPLFGNVKIIAGSDMTVRNDSPANAIWLQAESGTGYERTERCDCGTAAGRSVRSINGMSVDEVKIVGDGSCVSVESVANPPSVKISDTCSTPCCGCSELRFIESAIATINRSIATLNGYAEALSARITELDTNVAVTRASAEAYPS